MLTVHALSAIRGERLCFQGLHFEAQAGDLWWIEGRNGSGKSTLIRILAGLLAAESGDVSWNHEPTHQSLTFKQDLTYIGHLPGLHPHGRVQEELQFLHALNNNPCNTADLRADLEPFDLWRLRDQTIHTLSQGQKRKLGLARLWRTSTKLWLLDEPFASLDQHTRQHLKERLTSHTMAGGIVILATHRPDELHEGPNVHHLPLSNFAPKTSDRRAQ